MCRVMWLKKCSEFQVISTPICKTEHKKLKNTYFCTSQSLVRKHSFSYVQSCSKYKCCTGEAIGYNEHKPKTLLFRRQINP